MYYAHMLNLKIVSPLTGRTWIRDRSYVEDCGDFIVKASLSRSLLGKY
jgi:hypothetical protein